MNTNSSYLGIYRFLSSQTLNKVNKIHGLIDNEDISASDELYNLLSDVEDIFRRNRFEQFSDIARYRAHLLSSRIALDFRIPFKKNQLEATLALLPNLTQTLKDAMIPIENYLDEMRNTMRVLIKEAFQSKRVQWNEGLDFTEFIHALWRLFKNDPQFRDRIAPYISHVSEEDAIELLAEEFNRSKFSD